MGRKKVDSSGWWMGQRHFRLVCLFSIRIKFLISQSLLFGTQKTHLNWTKCPEINKKKMSFILFLSRFLQDSSTVMIVRCRTTSTQFRGRLKWSRRRKKAFQFSRKDELTKNPEKAISENLAPNCFQKQSNNKMETIKMMSKSLSDPMLVMVAMITCRHSSRQINGTWENQSFLFTIQCMAYTHIHTHTHTQKRSLKKRNNLRSQM